MSESSDPQRDRTVATLKVARLPDGFVAAHPDVAWRSMKATRNIVAHQYDHLDYEIIWNALARQLPVEADRIRMVFEDR